MVNTLKLEEMLEWIGPFSSEETVMTTEEAIAKMEQSRHSFVPMEYLKKSKSCIKPSDFPYVVWECVNNAANRGNKGNLDLPLTLIVHKGEQGIVVEIEDSGEGIPQEQIEKLLSDNPSTDCLYDEGKRGMGFYTLRTRLDTKTVNAIGFNEKRNAIYLMALF
ncbi:MAG: ATP-binding protein [Nanoarchaeota archaeon]|nr:ATP-binding protein [Nanoarchaeota archaeon]